MKRSIRWLGLMLGLGLVDQVLRAPVILVHQWHRMEYLLGDYNSILYERKEFHISIFEKESQQNITAERADITDNTESQNTISDKQLPEIQQEAPLVFLPDIASPLESWHDVSFPDDRLVRLMEGLGMGDSVLRKHFIRFSDLISAVHIITADLEQPMVLVGHGLGGWLAIRYAQERPETVKQLILINPSGFGQNIKLPRNTKETDEYLQLMLGEIWNPHFMLRDWLDVITNPVQESIAQEMMMEKSLATLELQQEIPMTIIWSEKDRLSPEIYRKEFAQKFTWATTTTLEGAYHAPQFTHASVLSKMIEQALIK